MAKRDCVRDIHCVQQAQWTCLQEDNQAGVEVDTCVQFPVCYRQCSETHVHTTLLPWVVRNQRLLQTVVVPTQAPPWPPITTTQSYFNGVNLVFTVTV